MARPQFVAAMASTMFASRTKPCFNLSPARLSSSCRPTCFLARPSLTHSRILPVPSQFPVFPTPPQFLGFSAAGSPGFSGPLLSLNPFDRNLGIPYVGAWNLSIQKELPWHFNMEVGYLGSEGVKLLQGLQLNQARLANAANPIVVGGANGVPQTTLTTDSTRDVNARVGVLGFTPTGLNTVTQNGHSSYHALEWPFLVTVFSPVGVKPNTPTRALAYWASHQQD